MGNSDLFSSCLAEDDDQYFPGVWRGSTHFGPSFNAIGFACPNIR